MSTSDNISGTGRFAFGENWRSFLEQLDEERIERAEAELCDRFGRERIEGARLLDAGCGSGLFSLAAHRLGAAHVTSIDYDADSVSCCRELRNRTDGSGVGWTVLQGDLLDDEFVTGLGRFDLVYCWGVAHHTGSMWEAIDNVCGATAPGGRLCMGIYNEAHTGIETSGRALRMKQLYQYLPPRLQKGMVLGYGVGVMLYRTLRSRELPDQWVESYHERGMSYWHDIRDWVGGYPFEFATPEAVVKHVTSSGPFEMVETDVPGPTSPAAVNTYIFDRTGH